MKTTDEIKNGLVEAIEEASWVVEGGDAHDLIDAVEKAHASMAAAISYIRQLEDHIGEITKKVEQLEAQAPKWISVEEPPKAKGAYLVRLKYPSGRVWKTWNLFHPDHGWCEVDEYMNSTLTHWMAFEDLPEPPKEA